MSLLILLLFLVVPAMADEVPSAINAWAEQFSAVGIGTKDEVKVVGYSVDDNARRVVLELNDVFGSQQWTQTRPQEIYSQVRQLLPTDVRSYSLVITTLGRPIEHLAPYAPLDTVARRPLTDYDGAPWVKNISLPYTFRYGLQGRHIALWASHGKYWSNDEQQWKWQRPYMNDVREDLFTPTIAYDLVVPMLEAAGAIVWSPRERSTALTEIITDNDVSPMEHYIEINGKHRWQDAGSGFAPLSTIIDHINPFAIGTARMAKGVVNRKQASTIVWRPDIRKAERLPVYVSYKSVPGSTKCAIYTVRHSGVETHFEVNQSMGSGTWVYLGEFLFGPNNPAANCVVLTNCTNDGGIVTADAVRLGAGWGNVQRDNGDISGEPRCNEGARYSMQWAGMPDTIYSHSAGESDYKDDINVRSLATNFLSGGSMYNPDDVGLHVPIELSLAMHTDAGINREGIVGSLGIVTTRFMDGVLSNGCSRLLSRDLAEEVLTSVCNDMPRICGRWNRRQLWDRNYSETRMPVVPSAIIEMLSHENPADVALMRDSINRFHLARALYKGVLRFVRRMHNMPEAIVQPLPVDNLRYKDQIVSWEPVLDPIEPTASPSMYLIQIAAPGCDFDCGTMLGTTSCKITNPPTPGTRIRITAINAGGASMPKEINTL